MLRGTFELLKEIDATGGVAETDIAKQLFRNAFIESFVFTRDRFSTSFLGRPRPLIALWLIIVTRCASGLIDLIEDRSAANRSGPAKEERKTLPG
jgi:hypothetical protein